MNNMNNSKLYGAFASVWIQYEGTLEQLANDLASALNLKSFVIEASEDPPHEKIGSAEAMGWEAWLQADSGYPSHNFRLRIETEHSITESFEHRMYDLSPWFARLVATLCDLKAFPEVPSSAK